MGRRPIDYCENKSEGQWHENLAINATKEVMHGHRPWASATTTSFCFVLAIHFFFAYQSEMGLVLMPRCTGSSIREVVHHEV